MQLAQDVCPGQSARMTTFLAREMAVLMLLTERDRRPRGEDGERGMRTNCRSRHDPACLAHTEEAELLGIDVGSLAKGLDGPARVGDQEAEVASLVTRAAPPARRAYAALVVGENRNPGVEERVDEGAGEQPRGWSTAVHPDDRRMRAIAFRQVQ